MRLHIFKYYTEDETNITTLSECLLNRRHILLIGEGEEKCAIDQILKQIQQDYIACKCLNATEPVLSRENKRIIDLDLPCSTFWALKTNERDSDRCGGSESLLSSEIKVYKGLKSYINRFSSKHFENYFKMFEKSSEVSASLEQRYERFIAYPARKDSSAQCFVAVIIPDPQPQMDNTDLEEQGIIFRWPGNSKENHFLNKYIIENDPRLSKEDKHEINKIIEKHIHFLMNAHTNLKVVKGSSVTSRKEGLEISNECCIALYCTGKGIIPLLETEFPTQLGGYKTDVREGCCSFGGVQDYQEKLPMGGSVGVNGGQKSGTLGVFVEEIDLQRNLTYSGFLTCSHVIKDNHTLLQELSQRKQLPSPRPCILQSSFTDDKSVPVETKKCGEACVTFIGNTNIGGKNFGVDLAYVRILDENRIPLNASFPDIDTNIARCNGFVKCPNKIFSILNLESDEVNRTVHKCGRTTGYTRGNLLLDGPAYVKYSEMHGDCGDRYIILHNLYEVVGSAGIFDGGDSGAAAFLKYSTDECGVIGLAVGSLTSGGQYFVCPMKAIMEVLGPDFRLKEFPTPMDID